MALEISPIIIRLVFGIYFYMLCIHFVCRLWETDAYNPITKNIVRYTTPVTRLLQKYLPCFNTVDTGVLLTAVLFNALTTFVLAMLLSAEIRLFYFLIWGFIAFLNTITDLYFFAIIIAVIASWVAPLSRHPLLELVRDVTEPLSQPLRKFTVVAGLDLSPIVLLIAINLIQIVLKTWAGDTGLPALLVVGI